MATSLIVRFTCVFTLFLLSTAIGWGQEPGPLPVSPTRLQLGKDFPMGVEPPLVGSSEVLSPLQVPKVDEQVQPAQFSRPTPTPGATPPGSPPAATAPPRPVADPACPLVRIQVRVPADAPQNDELKYILTVTNNSAADAHQVTVRDPIPEGTEPVKAEPKWDAPDKGATNPKQLVWSFGTLKAGQSRSIELYLKPKPGTSEVKNLAYVRFEHGEAVTTRLTKPTVKVGKTAPKQTIKDQPYTVRVTVENTGRVPAEKIRVVENIDRTAEVEAVTTGGQKTKGDNQWEWEVGTLHPGQRKVIEYRVTPRVAKDEAAESFAVTTTHVEAKNDVLEKTESRTQVLVPGLKLELKGPTNPVHPGEMAEYSIVVHNIGTMPSTNIRITGSIPPGCKPTSKTAEGQISRDAVTWVVPKLEPKKAYEVRFKLRAASSGFQKITATVTDARNERDSSDVTTLFEGTAALVWETSFDPPVMQVGGPQGMFTVNVKNHGGDDARNVVVTIEVPSEVEIKHISPVVKPSGNKVVFDSRSVRANGETSFTILFMAKQPGHARFHATLAAESLGDKPLVADKTITITGK